MSEIPTGPAASPLLGQIDEAGLEELFQRDPLLIQKKDLVAIIDYFRQERHRFQQMEAEGKFRKKKKNGDDPGIEAKKKANANLSIDNLDL